MGNISMRSLVENLRSLGLCRGDTLVLHSSMKSMGLKDGGPDNVIDAFLEVLGPGGTLMVPTFTYGEKYRDRPFDPAACESVNGLITETLRQRPDAVRSICPVHSVAAIGRRAVELTKDHLYSTTLGRNSPFHRLAEMGGYVVLLGCSHNANSTIHVAESLAELPFIYMPSHNNPDGTAAVMQQDGKVKHIPLTEFTGCSEAFHRAEVPLTNAGLIRLGKVGKADTQLMKSMDLLDVLVPILKEKPDFLLCDDPSCVYCMPRKDFLKRTFISKCRGHCSV